MSSWSVDYSQSVVMRHYTLVFSHVFSFWPHYSIPMYGFMFLHFVSGGVLLVFCVIHGATTVEQLRDLFLSMKALDLLKVTVRPLAHTDIWWY